jgi:hypothetical protein
LRPRPANAGEAVEKRDQMRAEPLALKEQIEQSMGLLRRHL